ncbi:MAG: cysteine--tRNA ligase [Mucinivorans sp.]
MESIYLYNTLSRRKELFEAIKPPFVGLYVCGPTVYGEGHLGHARAAITFDLLFRLLSAVGYKVRYVRNITDVGHLVGDADQGEDKIAKKAKSEELEPMEVAHYYTEKYHDAMRLLGVLSPSIEPRASGHIIEQIALTQKILDNGYAYLSNGSVYFDVQKYAARHSYGQLSGRNIDDIMTGTRELDGQSEKHFSADFALWKNASAEHIMRWPSPWGEGFPGWHAECSAMSAKYLGETFDIHGGGMDLMFPHHECEIAQSTAAQGHGSARYWVHNNMITIGGQKMGKSLGNFITLEEFFTGNHKLLSKAYEPMVIRFFILTAHYRSTLDFSDSALQAAEKGFVRLCKVWRALREIAPAQEPAEGSPLMNKCMEALCDDLNSPVAIAAIFDELGRINSHLDGKLTIEAKELAALRSTFDTVLGAILGLEATQAQVSGTLEGVMDLVLEMRAEAKKEKNWAMSDLVRDRLAALGVAVKDGKQGATWELK